MINIKNKMIALAIAPMLMFCNIGNAELNKSDMLCELEICVEVMFDIYHEEKPVNEGLGELLARVIPIMHQLELDILREDLELIKKSSSHEGSY